MSTVRQQRATLGALKRHGRADDDPDVIEVRRSLRSARLADAVAKAVAQYPPLTDDEKRQIVDILNGGSVPSSL